MGDWGNAYAPKTQFQSIRVFLAVIDYRERNFIVMDVSEAFLKSIPLEREVYVVRLHFRKRAKKQVGGYRNLSTA